MRRADRLFQIVQHLRGGRLVTARRLAERLEVCERTVYRDIRDLTLSGVPIEGEAGIGFVLRHGFDVPPLMFTREEIEALVLGARMVQAFAGERLADSAKEALAKIEAAVPDKLRQDLNASRLFAPNVPRAPEPIDLVRAAIHESRKIECAYTREDGKSSMRVLHPLGLYFWGRVWTLAAWCEMREDYRSFRLDRMTDLRVLDRQFEERPGHSLADFLKKVRGY
jgi:predicted DNA-binding transcriptional regulator YafY